MAKKKLKTRKSPPVSAPKAQNGTRVQGQVLVPYVQFGVPDAHAADVAEALGQLIISDIHRSMLRDRHE